MMMNAKNWERVKKQLAPRPTRADEYEMEMLGVKYDPYSYEWSRVPGSGTRKLDDWELHQ
jgi:hypothetical protein